MASKSNRSTWTSTAGKWSWSLGHRGNRVRLFQKRSGGVFYREVWIPGRGRDRACLHTSDRGEAERLGKQLLAALLTGKDGGIPGGKITLGELWLRYSQENHAFLDNKPSAKRDSALRAKVLMGYFGKACDVRRLTANDQAGFTRARLAGGIKYGDGQVTRPTRARSPESDLILLHAMLNWATRVRINGERWLDSNPLAGIRRPKEKNPKRPVATWERFVATRAAMQDFAREAETEQERMRWYRMELALVLAEATGRRLSSIRHLRWEDLDFEVGEIRWRAEFDKTGIEDVVPYPALFWEEMRQSRKKIGAVGGWLFAAEKNPAATMDRHLFDKWLTVAEKRAGLRKLDGGIWHPYRRAWATAKKHHPIKDLAAAGGWRDTETLLQCYQQPDKDTLLEVTSEVRKVREIRRRG